MHRDGENYRANDIYLSRYIASWYNAGGMPDDIPMSWGKWVEEDYKERGIDLPFIKWLRSEGLADWQIDDICKIARNGKLELESTAKKFIKH